MSMHARSTRAPGADERGAPAPVPRGARRTRRSSLLPLVLVGLLVLATVGCRDTFYVAQPGFVGAFGGHVLPAEGPAIALNVTTTLLATEELRYAFEGSIRELDDGAPFGAVYLQRIR